VSHDVPFDWQTSGLCLAFTASIRLLGRLAGGLHQNIIVLPEGAQECPPKLDL
jgi:hypothetical protein